MVRLRPPVVFSFLFVSLPNFVLGCQIWDNSVTACALFHLPIMIALALVVSCGGSVWVRPSEQIQGHNDYVTEDWVRL